ncbi:MAG: hypothetical protein HUJ25_04665 [Crocinitomicaceae bacterium]|nr:hypothetical protein [Crocinitomicaceae bacterium]
MTNLEVDQFIENLEKKKKTAIRIRGKSANPTKELTFRYSGVAHAPSVEIDHGKQTDYYEFEKAFSKGNLSELIAKWILFSNKARSASGQFYLVVDKKSEHRFQKIISEKDLDIEVISI